MATTVSGDGYTIGSNNEVQSGPFMYQYRDCSSVTFDSSNWTNIINSPDWGTPKRSVGTCYLYLPVRNDSGSWGGNYTRFYYRINSGSWTSCGHSGYSQTDTIMANTQAGSIDTQCTVWNFDFTGNTSNFTIGFRVDMQAHSGNGYFNGDSDVTTGGDSTYTFNYDANGNRSAVGGAYSTGHVIWLGQGNADVA